MDSPEKLNIELRPVLVKLLQGFLTHENRKQWEVLNNHQESVRNYFGALGLYLHLNREDGYAFLKTSPDENRQAKEDDSEMGSDQFSDISPDDSPNFGSSLIRKMPLAFDVSLLLVLLRENLEQYDESVSDDYRLILKEQDIYEQLKLFYQDSFAGGDEVKLFKKFDSLISKVISMGFLRELRANSRTYEVRRSIKAFINASQLKEIKLKMCKHLEGQKNV
jgi:hypothetical protein